MFELVKGFLVSRRPEPTDVFSCKSVKRGDNIGKVGDEASIEVSEAKERLNVLDISRDRPRKNAIKFGGVH